MTLPIDTIEEMIRHVPLYASGWEVCRGGTSVLIDGTEKVSKAAYIVIKPIAEVQSSQPLEDFNPHHK